MLVQKMHAARVVCMCIGAALIQYGIYEQAACKRVPPAGVAAICFPGSIPIGSCEPAQIRVGLD